MEPCQIVHNHRPARIIQVYAQQADASQKYLDYEAWAQDRQNKRQVIAKVLKATEEEDKERKVMEFTIGGVTFTAEIIHSLPASETGAAKEQIRYIAQRGSKGKNQRRNFSEQKKEWVHINRESQTVDVLGYKDVEFKFTKLEVSFLEWVKIVPETHPWSSIDQIAQTQNYQKSSVPQATLYNLHDHQQRLQDVPEGTVRVLPIGLCGAKKSILLTGLTGLPQDNDVWKR